MYLVNVCGFIFCMLVELCYQNQVSWTLGILFPPKQVRPLGGIFWLHEWQYKYISGCMSLINATDNSIKPNHMLTSSCPPTLTSNRWHRYYTSSVYLEKGVWTMFPRGKDEECYYHGYLCQMWFIVCPLQGPAYCTLYRNTSQFLFVFFDMVASWRLVRVKQNECTWWFPLTSSV